MALYKTEIKDNKDIITELIYYLPLKQKIFIKYCKQNHINKILVNTLTLMMDSQRCLGIIEMILRDLDQNETEVFLKGIKDGLLRKN